MKIYIKVTDDEGKEHEREVELIETKSTSKKTRKDVSTRIKLKHADIPSKILVLIAKKVGTLKIPNLVLIALKYNIQLTKSQQKEILKGWGKKVGEILESGSYNRDLINKGLVHDIGKHNGENVYELTAKGRIKADDILKKLEDESNDKK